MTEFIRVLSTTMIGLYAGSLLMEALILVPFWKQMSADDFFARHKEMGPSLFRYFAPLTTLAVSLSVLSAVLLRGRHIIVAVLCLTALAIFFGYFKKANASFADHSLPKTQLKPELKTWATWHWIRTVGVILALIVSVSA